MGSASVSSVQVLGCDIAVDHTLAEVQTSIVPYKATTDAVWEPSTVWDNWELPADSKDPILTNVSFPYQLITSIEINP
jgi:hypothetical protein